MARRKKEPLYDVDETLLNSEMKIKYDNLLYEKEMKMTELRVVAKKAGVDSPTTLSKAELKKRTADYEFARMYPEAYEMVKRDPNSKPNDKRKRIRGIYDEANGERCIGDVTVPNKIAEGAGLRSGDLVEGLAEVEEHGKVLDEVRSVEGDVPNAARPLFCDLVPVQPGRDFGAELAQTPLGEKIPDLKMGERVIVSGMTLDEAISFAAGNPSCIGLFFGVTAENTSRVGTDKFTVFFDDPQRTVLRKARLAIERAQRLSERGRDVILVVHGFDFTQDRDTERALFGAARCFARGSITVIADVGKGRDGGIYEKIATRII